MARSPTRTPFFSARVPHPFSPAATTYIWSMHGMPHPNSPAARTTDWSQTGGAHPLSPVGRNAEWSTASGLFIAGEDLNSISLTLKRQGFADPINPFPSSTNSSWQSPRWLPADVKDLLPSLPDGVTRFNRPPPYGQLVVWIRTDLHKDTQIYQEYPAEPDFYINLLKGDNASGRRLQEILTQYSRDMRYFVEDCEPALRRSPQLAREEIHRSKPELCKIVTEALGNDVSMAGDIDALTAALAKGHKAILDAAERTSFRPRTYPKWESSGTGGRPASETAPRSSSTTAARRAALPPPDLPAAAPPPPLPALPDIPDPAAIIDAVKNELPNLAQLPDIPDLPDVPELPAGLPPIPSADDIKDAAIAEGKKQLKKILDRHNPCKAMPSSWTKAVNTMVDPDFKDIVDKEVKDIIDGKIPRNKDGTWNVGDRQYGQHNNAIHPIAGPGMVMLNRMQHQLVKELNKKADDGLKMAEKLVEKEVLSRQEVQTVMQLWNKCK